MKKIPELLAPAGNMESVYAAINGGADAIYLGGKNFNARQNAGNLTTDQMKQVVALAKATGKKIYIVLNTLIKESEWQAVKEEVAFYHDLSVDGLIVQDLGLIDWILSIYPEISLQTSTQLTVYGLEGVRFFESLGISRVVLPREMPLADLVRIKEECSAELKIFIHGALCYAYSGQCLMSSQIGGRSGNRGLCAQPCRKIYRLLDEQNQEIKKGYLLSPKDLNTLNNLEDIVATGVDALKIEGRMKTPEYVYGVTHAYRQGLDQIAEGSKVHVDDQEVMQVFNRDFSPGHLMGDYQILNPLVGKNRGIKIGHVGKIKKVSKAYYNLPIKLDKGVDIAVGDGLSFGHDGKIGSRVDRIFLPDGQSLEKCTGHQDILIPVKGSYKEGMPVYRNFDAGLMKNLREAALADIKIPEQEIGMVVKIMADTYPQVQVFNQRRNIVFSGSQIPQPAQKNPLTVDLIKAQMSRLGGSDFVLKSIEVTCQDGLFLSKSQLNALRNESLAAFSQTTKVISVRPEKEMEPIGKLDLVPRISVQFEQMPNDLYLEDLLADMKNTDNLELVLPLRLDQQDKTIFEISRNLKKSGINVLYSLPQLMNDQHKEMLGTFRVSGDLKDSADGLLLANFESLELLKDHGYNLQADASFNVFNSRAVAALQKWGIRSLVCSPELKDQEIKDIGSKGLLPMVLGVYGHQKLMISKKCPFACRSCHGDCQQNKSGTLIDERGFSFPVRRGQNGLIHIYNGDCLLLSDPLSEKDGVSTWRIRVVNEDVATIKMVFNYFQKLMKKEKVIEPQLATKVTRGSFKRGVI
ncbi:MAG: family peptidase [Eubacteriaceae bacterium]|jgi:putative protease|nr:family peptidase [Eubacteriaceae bacterium]MDK2904148.1 family peptidase [Eubacteriaceae bacterium]MDK2936529.1 family peptidase [Eubacteriaceae bacterium]MDN5307167.1 family peptidase [Eubacteriaceae bacterium]